MHCRADWDITAIPWKIVSSSSGWFDDSSYDGHYSSDCDACVIL